MLAEGLISGFCNIPLMYLASTSMMRFCTPIEYSLSDRNAQYRPWSLSFGWENLHSLLLRVIELNRNSIDVWDHVNCIGRV
jgi:hypothetical protein